MKEYTYTMTIEEVSKRMSKGLATPDEVTQYTAEPPILPAWRVVELELSDVPEFIEKNGIFQFKELELSNPFTNYKNQTGEKIDFCIPNEVANEIAQQINAQHKADYFTKVEQEFTRMKNEQTDRLMDSPDHERGRLIAAERWERILNGRDTDGLQKEEINLRTAWADITEGICYIGGQRHRDRRKALQLAAPPYMANCGNGFAMEKKVDNQLRGIYIRARASYQFLQWLKELQANPMAATPTPTKDTDAETELTDVRETVVNILDPFQDAFIGADAFNKVVNRVCAYFEGEQQTTEKPIKVRKGYWKKVGKALGDIHKDIDNLNAIDYNYLKFAKETFDCFSTKDITNTNLAGITLYKYMIN